MNFMNFYESFYEIERIFCMSLEISGLFSTSRDTEPARSAHHRGDGGGLGVAGGVGGLHDGGPVDHEPRISVRFFLLPLFPQNTLNICIRVKPFLSPGCIIRKKFLSFLNPIIHDPPPPPPRAGRQGGGRVDAVGGQSGRGGCCLGGSCQGEKYPGISNTCRLC